MPANQILPGSADPPESSGECIRVLQLPDKPAGIMRPGHFTPSTFLMAARFSGLTIFFASAV